MKKTIKFLFLTFFKISFSQDLELIKFNYKPMADTYISEPTMMLSQKALVRRAKYNIELNIQDFPVETSYINKVVATGVEVIAISKWFNGIFAWATESQV
ncbi:MAG: peptidase S8, partial [Moheibacter sp.]